MGVTGLGSTFSYKYNFKTGKLSTKDGAQDDFVDFFNGTYDGQQPKTMFSSSTREKT